ncbi:MAG: glycosyltransferase family 2 protein [Idiomarinaceae bacterium]|uniref:glycosyltransferase family 2 protein n=1 Tax=Idiomarina sp. 28-8 TaxID=1260624 RepID=UPI0003031A0B|nr:glycosyltransferase family 2 protein [Idiomarina sp. 28-8]NWO01557.1 glycosyltransferase family 2 protein [Idiomarinaceae bacterium]
MTKNLNEKNIKQIPASQLRSEDEIISSWKGDVDKPLVSINCITYNHASYIEDALIGFLRQETDFPIEILVHDDASTDGTADIIRKYEALYPKLIKPIYQSENQYSKGFRLMPYNARRALGTYIAMCEGDDYWTDASKLNKQVTFLENNREYVISGHDAVILSEEGKLKSNIYLPSKMKRNFSGEELMRGEASLPTASWLYRNILNENIWERKRVKNGDLFFISLIGQYGCSRFHNDIKPSIYRVHKGGVWSRANSKERMKSLANTFFWMSLYYSRVGDFQMSEFYYSKFLRKNLNAVPFRVIVEEFLRRIVFFEKLKRFIRFFTSRLFRGI